MTIPAPSVMHFRLEPGAVSKIAYAGRDAIFDDLAVAYQKAVRAFYDAGCRYLQFDDTAWAYLCSKEQMQQARDRGLDVDHLQDSYAKMINKALQAKPADMAITTHVCRGNFRSTFISSGGYEPVAETLLAKCNYDGYFLEYDTDRAGGFEPLRFLPKGKKIVVLGLVTSKTRAARAARRHQEAHRGSDEVRRARSTGAVAAMRLCLDRGRQRARRRGAMGEAEDDRRAGQGGLGLSTPHLGGETKKKIEGVKHNVATYNAAVPRRPRRQPAAAGAAEEGARAARQGRDRRRRA